MDLLKANIKGHMRGGVFVKPYTTKTPSAKKKDKHLDAPQLGLFGGKHAAKVNPEPSAWHPRRGEHGEQVPIFHATEPTHPYTWTDPEAIATFVPDGDVPRELNGVPLRAWKDYPRSVDGWDFVDGQMDDLVEPPLSLPKGKTAASGVIIEEPDGRVWLVHPTNQFAGYQVTFPKGGAEMELSLQANAIKECFEESGLQVQITGLVGDFERGTTVARFYSAKRVGGTPTAMGWETQAVSLVPKAKMLDLLNGWADKPVAHAAGAVKAPEEGAEQIDGWSKISAQLGSNPGGFFKDGQGGEWYCKFPKSGDIAKNEILASLLYRELGLNAPAMKLVERNGKLGVASKNIDALMKDKAALIDGSAKGAREGFVIDAWLANWDSVGLLYDNMMVNEKGEAVRIDPGGALLFRAQGQPKGAAFGTTVGEMDTLRNGQNQQAAEVFAGVTDADIAAGLRRIVELSDERIDELVLQHGPGDHQQRIDLAAKLIERKKDLVSRYGDLLKNKA